MTARTTCDRCLGGRHNCWRGECACSCRALPAVARVAKPEPVPRQPRKTSTHNRKVEAILDPGLTDEQKKARMILMGMT